MMSWKELQLRLRLQRIRDKFMDEIEDFHFLSYNHQVVIDCFRLINPQLLMLGQEPRQTTSNVGIFLFDSDCFPKRASSSSISFVLEDYFEINFDFLSLRQVI